MGKKVNIFVKENETYEILINKDISIINFVVEKNANLTIKYINNNSSNIKINGQLKSNSLVKCLIADFSEKNVTFFSKICLVGKNAKIYWDLFSFADKTKKKFDINFFHNCEENIVFVKNIALAFNFSNLLFSCQNFIKKKSKRSLVDQNNRIFVFGKNTEVKVIPMLKINENNVIANHAAIIGDINNQYLFYLQSKGLSENESKKIIIEGYLDFFVKKFDFLINKKIAKILKKI
ncbi:SufD family Fe-S cluster assembly protein [bacterium]|nr:SufD family Fe-S cluster assembly protein [bacterium]